MKIEIPKELNEGQSTAYSKMIEFINGNKEDKKMFLLQGYAGTGKTYLVSSVIKYILQRFSDDKIAITAPTNKAVKVLRHSSKINNTNVVFQTIHRLLGLSERINNDGTISFVANNYEKSMINDFQFLIIDEVSMLQDELFKDIELFSKKLFIIFMGDPAQIPPVKRNDCIPFVPEKRSEYNIEVCSLTEIMRQKCDNPIINYSFLIRKELNNPDIHIERKTNIIANGTGIEFIDTKTEIKRDEFLSILNTYFLSKEFEVNPDYAKVICWTNKTVDRMNTIIREMIYGKPLKKINEWEKLIVKTPILEFDKLLGRQIILFNTNDELTVETYQIKTLPTEYQMVIDKDEEQLFQTEKDTVKYYDTVVSYNDFDKGKCIRSIIILHEDSEEKFQTIKKKLKDQAKKKMQSNVWKLYYDFIRKFADVGYNYAISCHKSQGSTYKNAFILEDDINFNTKVIERNRIKYTACTRPTDKLFLISKR